LSFDVKEPWAAHQKYVLFDERYADIFGRPDVTADRIVLLFSISNIISDALPSLTNQLIARYGLTKYLMLYILRGILEKDDAGNKLIVAPHEFVRDANIRIKLTECIRILVNDIIVDMNGELAENASDFDYKSKLKTKEWCSNFSKNIIASYLKLVQRGRLESFQIEWEKRQ
jgi:hypothetical protein